MAAIYTTLAEAKAQCHVDYDDDDVYIAGLQEMVEELVLIEIGGSALGEGLVSTAGTTTLTGVDTNFADYIVGDTITVEGETVRTIATITNDTLLTVSLAFTNTANGLEYTLHTGFPTRLPRGLKQSMLLMIAHFYNNREPVIIGVGATKMPYGFDMLIGPYKSWTVC
jgi:hypothetical protein